MGVMSLMLKAGKQDVSSEFTALELWARYKRRYFRTLFEKTTKKADLSGIEKHCLFIGYPRSGHTLVASLLDAHPNMIFSNGVEPSQYLERGFQFDQICCLYLRQAKRFVKNGSKSNGYRYLVPNQWNGRFSELKVVGDKSGDLLTERLRTNPDLLDKVLREKQVEHKFIHVIRNPFDNIATFSTRNKVSLEQSVAYYFSLCATVTNARQKIEPTHWLDIRHEDLIADTPRWLDRLCEFLGQRATPAYLNDCADIVFKSPRKTRDTVSWSPFLINRVEGEIRKYPFLTAYCFDK